MLNLGHAPVNINSILNDLKNNKVGVYQMNSIDDARQASSLSVGYLMSSDAVGYLIFCITWVYIEFKIGAGGYIFVRGKYGNSAFTNWKQIN